MSLDRGLKQRGCDVFRLCCKHASPMNDPRLLSNGKKTVIMSVLLGCMAVCGLFATICFPGFPAITDEFQVPPVVTTLVGALYLLFGGIGPVAWAALSEHFCVRQPLLVVGMLVLTVSSLGLAMMTSMAGLIVLRCVQAIGTSCTFSVGAGIVADCFAVERRGMAMSILYFGMFFGPLVGPILGGALVTTRLSWRATFWLCTAYSGAMLVLVSLFLPETFRDDALFDNVAPHPATSFQNDSGLDSSTISSSVVKGKTTSVPKKKPIMLVMIGPLLLLRHAHVILSSLVVAITFSCMFVVETILPDLLESHYGFSPWKIGLSYLGSGVGNMLGTLVNGLLSDRLLMRARRQRPGEQAVAEDRLAVHLWPCGLILMPVGLLMVGWGIQRSQSYWVPIIGFGIQAFGSQQILASMSAYMVDSAPGKGASVSAACNFVNMCLTSVLAIVATPLVHTIGPGFTLVVPCALVYVAMAILVCIKVFGQRMRRASGFEQPDEQEVMQ